MHYRTVVALLFACAVSLSYAQTPGAHLWSRNVTVSPTAPFNSTFGPFNLHDTATLMLTYSHLVQLCIVYSDYGLPHWSQYNEENCLFYHNSTKEKEDSIPNLPLLQATYQIGVYFANPDSKENTTLSLELTGDFCAQSTEYWNGADCIPATVLKPTNDTWQKDFGVGETVFYTYETGVALSHFAFSIDGPKAEDYILYARYTGLPTANLHDKSDNSNGTLKVIAPRQGMWVLSVHALSAFSASFKMEEFACGANSAGDGCTTEVRTPFTNTSITITNQDPWIYLRFVVDNKQALLVSVTTNNGSNIPYIYASKGQIPVQQGEVIIADIHNCNREYCDEVRSIVRNVTKPVVLGAAVNEEEEVWYIAIFTTVPGNTTFALWFNQTCVPNCDTDNHGECLNSGRCLCEIDYEGIDCSVSKGLGPQYIVLIIIASLVVASAIIGFVAWAYMRRKRNNYEIVS